MSFSSRSIFALRVWLHSINVGWEYFGVSFMCGVETMNVASQYLTAPLENMSTSMSTRDAYLCVHKYVVDAEQSQKLVRITPQQTPFEVF